MGREGGGVFVSAYLAITMGYSQPSLRDSIWARLLLPMERGRSVRNSGWLLRFGGGSGRGRRRSAFCLGGWGFIRRSTLIRGGGATVRAASTVLRLAGSSRLGSVVGGVETRTLEMGPGGGRNQPFHLALADRALLWIFSRKGLDQFKSMSALFALVFV